MNLQNKKLKIYSGFSRKNPRGVLISPGPGKIFTLFVVHVFDDCADKLFTYVSLSMFKFQVHLKIQEYHYRQCWNLDPQYLYLVSAWDCSALGKLLEVIF